MKPKQAVLILNKKRGETPLGCLNRFKKDNPKYENDKMTYAGRLDPLASGLLLVLVGEECKNKDKYLGLDKEYEVDVLFGFSTDTYDVLGLVKDTSSQSISDIKNILPTFVGKFSQKYPAFSSKTVGGEPLFALTKSGGISEEEIPTKDVEIKNIELINEKTISKSDLDFFIKDSVALVSGDFRQGEIIESWNKTLNNIKQEQFKIISIKVSCTSGTYMRSLANEIGIKIGIPALALNIRRNRVGEYILTK
jgi:tRNA pseudouridine55 synthase